jgi:tagatose 1,6-diphosphate aldolase
MASGGKEKRLRAVADQRGVIAALAIDQRDALRKLFAAATGDDAAAIPRPTMEEFKQAVSRTLTPFASAILLDPEIGLPAAAARSKNAGLLLAYEVTGFDKSVPGRLPRLLDGWTVARLVEAGADAVKTLLYYSPSSLVEINEKKFEWVERVGAECTAADVPYFLELVPYHDEVDEKTRDFAVLKPEIVTGGIEEFSKPRYQVDVLKVGVPVNMAFVEGSSANRGDVACTRDEAKQKFKKASDAAKLPFIYLSQGVSNELFIETLQLAIEAGSRFSGVLCGRATWKDGVKIFASLGMAALEEWLATTGVENIQRINAVLGGATPWFEFQGGSAHKNAGGA